MKRRTKAFVEYTRNNKLFLLIVSACLAAGVCIGAVMLVSLDAEQSEEISRYFAGFLTLSRAQSPSGSQIFWSSLTNMLQTALFLWLCGFTKLGIPIAPAIVGLRGFICGFTVAALIRHFLSKGLMASAIGILPQTLILFPCIMVFAVCAMNNAVAGIAAKGDKRGRFVQYTVSCAMLAAVMLLHVLIESHIAPGLIVWALKA